jgi:hypothetical protein
MHINQITFKIRPAQLGKQQGSYSSKRNNWRLINAQVVIFNDKPQQTKNVIFPVHLANLIITEITSLLGTSMSYLEEVGGGGAYMK